MSRLRELIAEFCPNGVEYKALGKMGSFFGGLSGKTKADFGEGYPFVTYMNVFANPKVNPDVVDYVRVDESERQNALHKGDVLFTVSSETPDECGMSSVVTFEPDGPLYLNSFCTGWRPDGKTALVPSYLAYVLRSHELRKQISRTANGVIRFNVSKPLLGQVRVPIPPIEIQREIVRILDSFQELDDALTAEIEAREKQCQYARSRCFERYFGNPASIELGKTGIKLGDLYTVSSSKRIYQSEQVADGVPFLRVADLISLIDGEDVTPDLFISDATYMDLQSSGYVPQTGDILVTVRGTLGRYYFVQEDDKFYFQDGMIAWLKQKSNSPSKYYFEALFSDVRFLERLISNCGQGTVKYLSIKGLAGTRVPVPDRDKSVLFDNEMDALENLNCLLQSLRLERDARRRQFAYYRDKLLDFPKKVVL